MNLALSVVIPTFRRPDILIETLKRIRLCDPAPDEVLVHVDFGDRETEKRVSAKFPYVTVLVADAPRGPGGGRNSLLSAVQSPIVVSLDDDSFPIDRDFFQRVVDCFEEHPAAGVLAMNVIHDNEPMVELGTTTHEVADFVGCGCAYRREAFEATSGYLPLKLAYGMEEADLALQLLDNDWKIIQCAQLRVRHATDRSHQTSSAVVAAHVRNTALHAFLRYPCRLLPYGVVQIANRCLYSLKRGHVWGVVKGLLSTPAALSVNWHQRKPLSGSTVMRRRNLRRQVVRGR